MITIRDIIYYPWQTDYYVVIESGKEKHDAWITRSGDGALRKKKDTDGHPAVVRLAIAEVRHHLAMVELD
jgi:hypothetical protein